jgi:SulP family sulfate permease
MTEASEPARKSQLIAGDLIGGLLAAIIALPLALAFGVASGLGATAGLYGAIACGIVAAIFGGTPGMLSGPTGPVTVMIAALALQHPDQPELVLASGVAAGIFQIILGRLKTGQLIQYIPHPVVSGFMTGIGVIIISIQLLPLIGLPTEGDIFTAFEMLWLKGSQANISALLLGIATIVSIYLVQKLPWKIPPLLVALLGGTLASLYLHLEVPTIGEIPAGLPQLHLPVFNFELIHVVLASGLSFAVVGSIDSLLTAVLVDKTTKQRHESNRELVAQGLGNIVAGLFGGIAGSGTTMPSMVNVSSGGRTRLSGMFAGGLLLAVLLGLGPIASKIPTAVLAGILITVGIGIVDTKTLATIKTAPKADTAVMLIVLILTVFVDLIMAVAIGVALASTIFAKRMADTKRSKIRPVETVQRWRELTERLPQSVRDDVYLYDFMGPIFFGEVNNFIDVWSELKESKVVILRFNNVPFIDQSGAYALDDALEDWQGIPGGVVFVGLNDTNRSVLIGVGIAVNSENCFATVDDALLALSKRKWHDPSTQSERAPRSQKSAQATGTSVK